MFSSLSSRLAVILPENSIRLCIAQHRGMGLQGTRQNSPRGALPLQVPDTSLLATSAAWKPCYEQAETSIPRWDTGGRWLEHKGRVTQTTQIFNCRVAFNISRRFPLEMHERSRTNGGDIEFLVHISSLNAGMLSWSSIVLLGWCLKCLAVPLAKVLIHSCWGHRRSHFCYLPMHTYQHLHLGSTDSVWDSRYKHAFIILQSLA